MAQLINADLRPYRLPFLRRLAERPEIELTVYVGGAAPGRGAPAEQPPSPVPIENVLTLRWPRSGKIAFQTGVFRILRSDADVIVCAEAIHNMTIWMIRLLHRLMGKSLVLIGFFWRPTPKKNLAFALRSNLLRFLRRSAGALIAYTERGRQELIARGMEPEKVFVSHNTLDTDRLSDIAASVDPLEVEELRERVTPGMRRPLLMFLGRLLPEKGPNIAIEVLRALTRLGLSAALWVVGDGPELKSLQRLANGLPVAFFGAEYDEVRVAQYLAAADFLVIPGRVGLGCVQGFSSGVPCLTTNPDSVLQSPEVDYVIDGFNGYLVDSQDPVEYAHRIERAWRDQILYDSLCEGARATARELTMDRMVSAFVSATQFARGR